MESAIPKHLETARTRTPRALGDYVPPYPSFVARFKPAINRVVMAYFGVQYRPAHESAARAALSRFAADFALADGPGHWDRARYIDEAGYATVLSVGYWDDVKVFERWFTATARQSWWNDEARLLDGPGYFLEILQPRQESFETLFSANDRPEGVANIAGGMSGMVKEHAYWGGARDRIPQSQTDAMNSSGQPAANSVPGTAGKRVRIAPHDNACLIRSGQDWSDTDAEERSMYLNDVEPVLRAGMDFLRDEGRTVGCFANRYVRVHDRNGPETEKSYGMSWWRSLADLERWAESHPTHVAIFGAAMQYLSKLGPAAKLKLYHEVSVVRADEQRFEYINCHDRTGMLRAARS